MVNLIDVTLACEDANSKLVKVVTVADVDSEDHVGNSLFQIWELTFGPRVAGLGRLSAGAKMAMKPFVKRVFTIFATNASFLRVISNF